MVSEVLILTETQHNAFITLKQKGVDKALSCIYDGSRKYTHGTWKEGAYWEPLNSVNREKLALAVTGAIKVHVKLTPVERIRRLYLEAESERNRFLREVQQPEMSVAYTKMEAYKQCLEILAEAEKDGEL